MERLIKRLKWLKKNNYIGIQAYRTYIGQIKAGDIKGCIKGMQRNKLL